MRAEGARAWLLAALLAVLAPLARAGNEQERTVGGVRVLAGYDWPEMVYKGYVPLRVEAVNESPGARDLRLELRHQGVGSGLRVTKSFRLEPGERGRAELLLPAFPLHGWPVAASYGLELRCDGKRAYIGGIGPTDPPDANVHPVLWVSRRPLPAGEAERLANRISWATARGNRDSFRYWQRPGSKRPFEQSQGTAGKDAAVTGLTFDALPSRYEAYTSLDAVVVDLSGGAPDEERLDPLLAWARTGGVVAFLGPGAEGLLSDARHTAGWMEDRFDAGSTPGCRAWRFGHGLLIAGADEPLAESQRDVLRDALGDHAAWIPSPGRAASQDLQIPRVPGIDDLPYRGLVALLVLFAIVIGPVNFLVLKRLRKPGWLLWTIPSISVLASLLLLAYGVLHQGLDVKSASRSITVLDQRARNAATVELRSFFAGLSPGVGLELEAGTSCYPVAAHLDDPFFWVDFDRGGMLRGDFLPARRMVGHVLLGDRIARLRLDFLRTEGGFELENGLGDLRAVVLCDAEGQLFLSTGRIREGERGLLEPVEGSPFEDHANPLTTWIGDHPELLPPSSYVAIPDESPFTDDGGVDMNELLSEHAVLGILPRYEEDWRR